MPTWAEAHANLALAYQAKNQSEQAIGHFREAIKLNPDLTGARENLGAALLGQRKLEEAAAECEECVRRVPKSSESRRKLADALRREGKEKEALAQLAEAIQITPDDAAAHFLMGMIQAEAGDLGNAIPHYREALKQRPDYAEALNNLAWILATSAQPQFHDGSQAIKLAMRACERLAYKDPEALDTLAAAYAAASRFQEACVTARKAIDAAEKSGLATDAKILKGHLDLFDSGRPYIQTAK